MMANQIREGEGTIARHLRAFHMPGFLDLLHPSSQSVDWRRL